MKPGFKSLPVGLLLATLFGTVGGCALAADQAAPTAAPAAAAAVPQPVRKPMFTEALAGLPGHEGLMYITDFPPGSVSTHHSHPGYEFNYILKGAVTFMVDGQAPFTLTAGQGTYNPRDRAHVVKNASATEPAQLVAVLINDAGKPIAVNLP